MIGADGRVIGGYLCMLVTASHEQVLTVGLPFVSPVLLLQLRPGFRRSVNRWTGAFVASTQFWNQQNRCRCTFKRRYLCKLVTASHGRVGKSDLPFVSPILFRIQQNHGCWGLSHGVGGWLTLQPMQWRYRKVSTTQCWDDAYGSPRPSDAV